MGKEGERQGRNSGRVERREERKEKWHRKEKIEGCVLLSIKLQSCIMRPVWCSRQLLWQQDLFHSSGSRAVCFESSTELIHYNHLLLWQQHWTYFNRPLQFQQIFGHRNHVHTSLVTCVCGWVCTWTIMAITILACYSLVYGDRGTGEVQGRNSGRAGRKRWRKIRKERETKEEKDSWSQNRTAVLHHMWRPVPVIISCYGNKVLVADY